MAACCQSRAPRLGKRRGLWQQCTCAVVGGLLCSSCCVVQLVLNSFSIGCAGFSVLTPYRPAFLSVTAAALLGNYIRYRNKRRTAIALAIAFGLSFTPELVQLYNENKLGKLVAALSFKDVSKNARSCSSTEWIQVKATGMKCLACCARVKQHVLATTRAEECEVEFESGLLTVRGSQVTTEEIVSAVETLGYSAVGQTPVCPSTITQRH